MSDLSDLIRSIGENFVLLANEIDRQQKETNRDITDIKAEVSRNRCLLKNIANMINEELGYVGK